MELIKGTVVVSRAGRDKGEFLAVARVDGADVYLVDGKYRPLARPKKKNPKHFAVTNHVLCEDDMRSDRSLKHALSSIRRKGTDE